jgi:phosphotransferase system IIB component
MYAARLKALGAAGVMEVGNNVQAVCGTQAELLKNDIKDALCRSRSRVSAQDDSPSRALEMNGDVDRRRSA